MGSQVSAKTNDKEQQLKKASKMAMVRALLPIVGLVVIFLLFNVLTDFRMMGYMSLAFSQVYVTMIAAMGVFFIMTMGGLDFSQGSILGIASIVVCILSKHGIGMGDIKLLCAVSILGGVYLISGVIFFAMLSCSITAISLLITKKKTIKEGIPFGPFIYLGYIVSIILLIY